MVKSCLPGTNIQMDLQGGQDYRCTLNAVFAITGGVYLSQLAEMVGVPGATLQNWVKRGFVANPVNKRYTRRQTCRIILIALLRHILPLEDITALLSSINHNLADEQDDLIDDSELYLYFCDVVLNLPESSYFDPQELAGRIETVTKPFAAAGLPGNTANLELLQQVLTTMVLAYGAWQLRDQATGILAQIKRKEQIP
ncbi:MAG TPA: hypothetical protein DD640_05820 [Clostridiales bacterium]|nr:hypothetical protein [Clostridiales bacterium]